MSERDPRDETGKFVSPKDVIRYRSIIVWNLESEGDSVAHRWHATDRDLEELERMYGDDPAMQIQTEVI